MTFWFFFTKSKNYAITPMSLIKKGHGQRKNLSYGHQMVTKTFPPTNLNFHWRWRWWNQIQAIFSNLFYFKSTCRKINHAEYNCGNHLSQWWLELSLTWDCLQMKSEGFILFPEINQLLLKRSLNSHVMAMFGLHTNLRMK